MNAGFIILALVAQLAMVTGQILLKRAMAGRAAPGQPSPFAIRFTTAIACMTVYFFLWLGVLNHVPLSQLAPFDALGPVLLVTAAGVLLHERLSFRAWIGVSLILAGITLVAFSA